jgi:hypothetical protein
MYKAQEHLMCFLADKGNTGASLTWHWDPHSFRKGQLWKLNRAIPVEKWQHGELQGTVLRMSFSALEIAQLRCLH